MLLNGHQWRSNCHQLQETSEYPVIIRFSRREGSQLSSVSKSGDVPRGASEKEPVLLRTFQLEELAY